MTVSCPWIQISTKVLQGLVEKPTDCLLLIDPQKHNADCLAQQFISTTLCKDKKYDENYTPKACGKCQPCHLRLADNHPDILYYRDVLNIDAIRKLNERIIQTPSIGAHRFIYLSHIDDFNESALNALLKTLEEPSKHNHFILSASTRRAVKATIISRARVVMVNQPSKQQALEWLCLQNWDKEKAQEQLNLYHHDPFQVLAQKDFPSPTDLLEDFINFCANPKHHHVFLKQLDDYIRGIETKDKQAKNKTLEALCINSELIIHAIQLDSWPQNWHNPDLYRTLLQQIDLNDLHALYTALCHLRQPNRQQINIDLTIKSLLLQHMQARNFVL